MRTVGGELYHYGVKGMKWGVRRYQPYPSGKSGRFVGKRQGSNRVNKNSETSSPNKKKGLSTAAKAALGVAGVVAAKSAFDTYRNVKTTNDLLKATGVDSKLPLSVVVPAGVFAAGKWAAKSALLTYGGVKLAEFAKGKINKAKSSKQVSESQGSFVSQKDHTPKGTFKDSNNRLNDKYRKYAKSANQQNKLIFDKKKKKYVHEDYLEAHNKKNKKKVSQMSDAELKKRVERLKREEQYKKLEDTKINKGKKAYATVIAGITAATTIAGIAYKAKKLNDSRNPALSSLKRAARAADRARKSEKRLAKKAIDRTLRAAARGRFDR